MSDLQEIARTVSTLATPGMKPKDLVAAVRKRHPDASKKQVSRAAFMAMIIAAEADPNRATELQELALGSRGSDDEMPGLEPGALPATATSAGLRRTRGRRSVSSSS